MPTIEARAPGKLFVAGEYAVVTPGEPAVLVAVDRHITATLSPAEHGSVAADGHLSAPLPWAVGDDGRLTTRPTAARHVLAAVEVVERLRAERGLLPRPFSVHLRSTLTHGGRKYGLGSSGAVVCAVVAAALAHHGLEVSSEERFRLALLATIGLSPRASGGDVAASTWGGWLRYASPDREELLADLPGGVERALGSAGWDPCRIDALPEPDGLELLVGWTGSPAATDTLVGRANAGLRPGSARHDRFLEMRRAGVATLVAGLREPRPDAVTAGLTEARAALLYLADEGHLGIETPELAALIAAAEVRGAAAKSSGAGGGDCGIVLARRDCDGIHADWRDAGIVSLNLVVASGTQVRAGGSDTEEWQR